MFNGYINNHVINKIMDNQESVFLHFLGLSPQTGIRILSPFRTDNKPDCRFENAKGIWYFIDNAGYNGQIAFNCIWFVANLLDVSYKEAVETIMIEVTLKDIVYTKYDKFSFDLRYTYREVSEDNYFSKNYDLPVEYLSNQNVKSVVNYWCNTKNNNNISLNPFHNPKINDCYAFNVNKRTELYFPDCTPKSIKNTKALDFYGDENKHTLILTEGNKDRMILNYHLGLDSLGLQNANIILPDYFNKKKLYVWFDPDEAGLKASIKIKERFDNVTILTNLEHQYDIADIYKFQGLQKLKECILF